MTVRPPVAEWRWIESFAAQFKVNGVTPGMECIVLSESASRPDLVETRVGIFWISKRYCWDMSLKSCYKASWCNTPDLAARVLIDKVEMEGGAPKI